METDFGKHLISIQVAALILFQVTVTVFLWRLNAVTTVSTGLFAIFLSADLLSFALISNMYRQGKQNREPSAKWLIVGYVVLGLLLFASFLRIG